MARIEFPLGAIPVTGSDDFVIIDELAVLGRIVNPSGSLVLSSSVGSDTIVSGNLHVKGGGSVTVDGNVTVGGNVTFVSSSNLLIHDPLIVLALSQSAISPQFDSGFIIERGTGENRAFIWREADSRFAAIETDETGSTAGSITIKGYSPLKILSLVLHSGALTADSTHLILSSSVGSKVFVSGAFSASDGIHTPGQSSATTLRANDVNSGRLTLSNAIVATPYATINQGSDYLFAWTGGTFRKAGYLADIDIQWKSTTTGDATSRTSDDTGIGRQSEGIIYISGSTHGGITANKGHLILSSSVGSLVMISGALSAAFGISVGSGKTVNIRGSTATNGVRLNSAFAAFGAGPGLYLTQDDGAGTGVYSVAQNFRGFNYGAGDTDFDLGSLTTFSNPRGLKMGLGYAIKWFGPAGTGGGAIQTTNNTGELLIGRNDSGSLYISGSDGRNEIVAKNSHLILSSAAGSTLTFSGSSVIFQAGTSGQNINLYGDGSSNIQFRSAAAGFRGSISHDSTRMQFFALGDGTNSKIRIHTAGTTIGNVDATERLSVSGNIDLIDQVSAKIYARNTHLILSSSAGSQVTISGTLSVDGNNNINAGSAAQINVGRVSINDNNNPSMFFTNGGTFGLGQGSTIFWTNTTSGIVGTNAITKVRQAGTGSISFSGSNLSGGFTIGSETGHLIFSASSGIVSLSATLFFSGATSNPGAVGTRVAVLPLGKEIGSETHSGNKIGWNLAVGGGGTSAGDLILQGNNLVYVVAGGYQWINRDNGVLNLNTTTPSTCKMVLSASGGHIRISGTLGLQKATSTAMPVGSDEISGSMVWVNDLKCAAIYGPEGWTRIVTGSSI